MYFSNYKLYFILIFYLDKYRFISLLICTMPLWQLWTQLEYSVYPPGVTVTQRMTKKVTYYTRIEHNIHRILSEHTESEDDKVEDMETVDEQSSTLWNDLTC